MLNHERRRAPDSDADELPMARPPAWRPIDCEIGARLAGARKNAGLKQSAVALAMGWGQSTLSEIETGKRSLQARDLGALAACLGCEVADLLPAGWRK